MEGQEEGADIKDRTRHAEGASLLKSLSSQLTAAGVSVVLTIRSPPFKSSTHCEDDPYLLFLSGSSIPFSIWELKFVLYIFLCCLLETLYVILQKNLDYFKFLVAHFEGYYGNTASQESFQMS